MFFLAVLSSVARLSATSASCDVVQTMNSWANQSATSLLFQSPLAVAALYERMTTLRQFCTAHVPRIAHSLPVLYLFSGMDLLTAYGCLPTAPEYVLLADFPTGDIGCFTSSACRRRATESASMFFQHWANLGFSRQSTNAMRRYFSPEVEGFRVGVLPAMLLCLKLINQTITVAQSETFEISVARSIALSGRRSEETGRAIDYLRPSRHIQHRGDTSIPNTSTTDVLRSLRLHTEKGKLDAVSRAISGKDEQDTMSTIGNTKRLFVTIFKAAPHWILRNNWMARWVFSWSQLIIQDETGLRPHMFNKTMGEALDEWNVRTLGKFTQFENREIKWYHGESEELKRVFPGPKLPFKFGYGQDGNPGVLLLASRRVEGIPLQ